MRGLLKLLLICFGFVCGMNATGTSFNIDVNVRSRSNRLPNHSRRYKDW